MFRHRTPIATVRVHPERSWPRRRRTWGTASAIVGITALVAACGTSGATTQAVPSTASSGSPKIVLAAYTQTLGARTAKVSISVAATQTTATQGTQHASASVTGSINFTTHNAELTISAADTSTFVERFVNPVLYIQIPSSARSQLSAGKPWAGINLNTVSEADLGASLSQLSASSQESTQVLTYLQAVSSSGITAVGPAPSEGSPRPNTKRLST